MTWTIRENRLMGARYAQRDGSWGPYKTAKRFANQRAADYFAESHDIQVYGLFP